MEPTFFDYSILATIIVALIGASLSFVQLTLTKELKTSEFRQAWIDSLREDLSTFFGCSRTMARATEEHHYFKQNNNNENEFQISKDKISDIRYNVTEVYSRIILRLNPKDTQHNELLRLINTAIKKQNHFFENKTNSIETMKAIERATDYARPLMKKEWERVKQGEPAFNRARNWALSLIIVLVAILLLILFK